MDDFDSPTLALECAKKLMNAMGKKAINYVGEWNQLLVYLERQTRKMNE